MGGWCRARARRRQSMVSTACAAARMHPPRRMVGLCKHRLAVAIYRRAQAELSRTQHQEDEVPGLEPEPEATPQGLKPQWLVMIRGKRFIRYEGLLTLAQVLP